MTHNRHSPGVKLKNALKNKFKEHELVFEDYCIFIPIMGLGDKLAYLSSLHHLKSQGMKICILAYSADGLLFLYKEVADFMIMVDDIFLDPWLHGDNHVSTGNICFMWHPLYFDGYLQEVEGVQKGIFDNYIGGHKLAVKSSLGLPIDSPIKSLSGIDSIVKSNISEDYVFLSPISNSYTSCMEGDRLFEVIKLLEKRNLRVVLNTSDKNIKKIDFQKVESVKLFEGSLTEALAVARGAKFSINSRSGLSELYSMLDIPFIDIHNGPINPFWSLKENFFRPPVYELSGVDELNDACLAKLQNSII